MTAPDRDDQVITLMTAALALGAPERNDYLRAACSGDEGLFEEVHEAVAWEERMGGFLCTPWMSLQNLERPLQPGQLINGRFEINREIGHGGMGIVYEAFDRKRGQRIAIKSAKLGFRRLCLRELEAALRVRHGNVCLVNEIHTAATEYGDVDFLTMELLEGPTLQSRLASDGPLDQREAFEVARQLCAGLAEAHRMGVIHKDLKTANIILSRLPDGSPRAVITDFGLAGATAPGSDLAGTPRYMAPELWRGAAASKASDIYALGVILYEMVTGDTPFLGEPSQVRLTRAPVPPSSRKRTLDQRWDRAILRCLDPSPEARPRDAADVLALLSRPRIRKAPLLAAMAVLIAVGVSLRGPVIEHFRPANSRLAILPADGDSAAIGAGALDDVADRLGHYGGPSTLVVISPQRALASDVRTPQQAYRTFNATHALRVTFRRMGNDLLARGTVIDLATQTQLQEIAGRYAPSRAGDLSAALVGAVAKALHLQGVAGEAISAAAAAPYLQGLAYLRRDQHSFDAAIPLFEAAEKLDPRSPLPKAGLVESLVLRYQDTKDPRWIAEARQKLQAAEAVNPTSVAVLMAAGRLAAANSYYETALDSYRRVAEIQPRNVEVWLRIAEICDRLDRHKEAVESYQKAIALEPAYYETYEELGFFYYTHGEYAEAVSQFRKVIERAPRFLNAYLNLGATLSDMGQDDEAAAALTKSLQIRETAGALNSLGAIKAYQKRDAEALDFYRKALAVDGTSYVCLMNLGDSSRRLGLAGDAQNYYERGIAIALKELQLNPRNGKVRAYVGTFAARLGDRSRAQDEIDQALQLAPADKWVIRRAVLTYEMLGDREKALRIAETATASTLGEFDRHPDLADFREDPRFRELKARREKGG